jgi:RHS repeat-associated protein
VQDPNTGLQEDGWRWLQLSTGKWLSDDPIGFAAGDADLYRYVGNDPANYTDPSGLWKITRDPSSQTATAVSENRDTLDSLATTLGLNSSEFQKWLGGPATVKLDHAPGKSVRSNMVAFADIEKYTSSGTNAIAPGQTFTIPNTVAFVWAGDSLGGLGQWAVDWNDEIAYAKKLGFYVVEYDASTTSAADTLAGISELGSNKQLQGIVVTAHGSAWSFGDDDWTISSDDLWKGLPYHLGFSILNSCFSGYSKKDSGLGIRRPKKLLFGPSIFKPVSYVDDELTIDRGGRDLVSKSSGALFSGSKDILIPVKDTGKLSDLFGGTGSKNQGTNKIDSN